MRLNWSVTALLIFLITFTAWSQEGGVLSLRDCVRIALERNITIQTYDNLAQGAANSVKASYSNILPQVSVSYNGGIFRSGDATTQADVPISTVIIDTINGVPVPITQTIGFTNQEVINPGFKRDFYSVSFDINQNVFDGGNWWNAIKQSKADRDVAKYDYNARSNEVVKLVSQYFFDLLKQEKLYEVYELSVQRSQDNLEKSEKMFEIGSVAKVDVFRARVNLGNDRIALIQQRNTLQQARQTLNIALRRHPQDPLNIQKEFSYEYQLASVDQLVETALENQPEIRRREMVARSRELTASRAKSSFFPTLSAFFSYNRDNAELKKIYSDLNQNWSTTIGVGGRWNLFNGFADQVRVQNAKIDQKNALLALEEYKLNLRANIAALHDTYKNLEEIVEINKENLEAAREEYRLATERYRLGSGTSLDVRESQVNLTDAERILVAAEYNLIITYAELLEAIGTIQNLFQ